MREIVVLSGSPRVGGNTDILVESFVKGAEASGNNVTVIKVSNKRIAPCTGCNACFNNESNSCVISDDMVECYGLMAEADVIVAATPVYFYGVSAQLKCLIDRLHNPIRNGFKVKKLCLLSVCADRDDAAFEPLRSMFNAVIKYFSLENGGEVTVCGVKNKGDIIGNPKLSEAEALGRSV